MKTVSSPFRLGMLGVVAACLIHPTRGGDSPQIAWMAGGHPFGAAAVRFTSDGRHLVSGGAGLKVWDVAARRLERTLSQPRVGDDAFALSADDRWAASVPWHPDRSLTIRDTRDGAEYARFPLEALTIPFASLSCSPDGAWVLGSTTDGVLHRWHLPTRATLPPLGIDRIKQSSPVYVWATLVSSNAFIGADFTSVYRAELEPPRLVWEQQFDTPGLPAVAPDARHLAACLSDRLLLLDAASGEVLWESEPMVDPPVHLAISADGQRVVGIHKNVELRVWRAGDGGLEMALPGVSEIVTAVAVSPDGRTVAASHNRGIALWDLEQRTGPEELTQLPSIIRSLAVSENGRVAVATALGDVAIYDQDTGRRIAAWRTVAGGHALAMAPTGDWLVTRGTNAALSVFALPTGAFLRSVPLPAANPEQLELSATGLRLAVMPLEGGPTILRTTDWTVERTLDIRPATYLRSIHLAPDGGWLAGVLPDRSIRVWQMADGRSLGSLPPQGSGPGAVAFDNPPPWLRVLGADGMVLKWNAATGELENGPTLGVANFVQAMWLPDRSAVLVSVADEGLELWRIDSGQRVKRYDAEVGRACFAMVCSPDERTLLPGLAEGQIAHARHLPTACGRP